MTSRQFVLKRYPDAVLKRMPSGYFVYSGDLVLGARESSRTAWDRAKNAVQNEIREEQEKNPKPSISSLRGGSKKIADAAKSYLKNRGNG